MIIAERTDFERYIPMNSHFLTVYNFLKNTDLTSLKEGRIEIDGEKVFANCMSYIAEEIEGEQFEAHKKYTDIHLVISNKEFVAVSSPIHSVLKLDYNQQDDTVIYNSSTYQMVQLTENNLLITFAEDFHQPKIRINDRVVKKLVIKVENDDHSHKNE